jgi:hypothetical protein
MKQKNKKPESCPFCGGVNGVESSREVRFTVLYQWDGNSIVTSDKILSERKTGKCWDCGKIVSIPT